MNRAYAIDILRCLAIIGMVLSAQIVWNADLPAWIFHAQTPPPTFAFDPSVSGITWVDLVFPFFLFSMGAAFPLAMRRKLDKKVNRVKITGWIIKRWLLLSFFAIALANTRSGVIAQISSEYLRSVLLLVTWCLFFCSFVRINSISPKTNAILNIVGICGLIGLMAGYKYVLGADISLYKNDIIILVLANMALFGTLIWWGTKDNILLRLAVIAVFVGLRLGASVEGSWNEAVWSWSPASWLYKMEFLKYLCIVLPGTIAGDMIWKWMHSKQSLTELRKKCVLTSVILITIIFITVMWSMFTRHIAIGLLIVIALSFFAYSTLKKDISETGRLHKGLFEWGVFWLLLGFAFEAIEGGIKKDHATFSYFFITSGLACHAVAIFSILLNYFKLKFGILVKCGQNPMIAYTASGYVIIPFFALTYINVLLQTMAAWGPWWGVLKGVVITTLMMFFTVIFTNKKIFWRT